MVFVHPVETQKVYVSDFSIRNPENVAGLWEFASGENLLRGKDVVIPR